MASPVLAVLTPAQILSGSSAGAQPEDLSAVAFCGCIELHEGSQVLGRELFGTHKVPHVSRRHLQLDVRLREIEVTVVGQNPAAITNLGFPTIRLQPGESALLRDRGMLEFLPGRLQYEVNLQGASCHPIARNLDVERVGLPEIFERQVAHSVKGRRQEGTDSDAQLSGVLALRENQQTPPLIGQTSVPRMPLDNQSPLNSRSVPLLVEIGGAGSSAVLQAEHPLLGEVQVDAQDDDCHRGGQPSSHQDQLAQDEDLARKLQKEEGAHGGAHSHHSKEQLASDEALARMLQEQEGGAGDEGRVEGPDRKRRRRGETEGAAGEAATSGRSPEEGGAHGSDGPGAFQLLQVHALPPWAKRGCCRISDVIRGDVQWCILTNYMIDIEWLLSACPILYHVPRVILMHGESGASLERLQSTKPANFSLHKPPLPISYGTHHSKAMVVVYRGGVRVVVHTANLIYIDWNNKTQGLWYQDFPLKTPDSPPSSPFERDLLDYLEALRWPGALVPSPDGTDEATRVNASFFRRFDFSRAAVRLVGSVPGYHGGAALRKWGHMKMRAVLEEEAFGDDFRRAPLVYQFSSLGSLDERWMSEFLASLSKGRTASGPPLGLGEVRVVWPTVEDVRQSIEGYCAGGAIPGPEKNVARPWLQRYWSKFQADHAGRGRVMPHIKTFVRHRGNDVAWCLLTSANLSKAAWGSLQRNDTQLMVRSYELGVLFVPSLVARYGLGEQFSCTDNAAGGAGQNLRILTPGGNRKTSGGVAQKARVEEVKEGGEVGACEGESIFEAGSPGGFEKGGPTSGKRKRTGERSGGEGSETRTREEAAGEKGRAEGPGGRTGGDAQGQRTVRFVSTAERPGPHDSQLPNSEPSDGTPVIVRLPIPYALPPAKYGPKDRPWAVDRQYVQPDVYGETWPRTVVKYGVKQADEGE